MHMLSYLSLLIVHGTGLLPYAGSRANSFVYSDKTVEEALFILFAVVARIADPFVYADEQVEHGAIGLSPAGSTHLPGCQAAVRGQADAGSDPAGKCEICLPCSF